AHNGLRDARERRTIFQERRTAILTNDFVDRATEIEIDKIRGDPIHNLPGRFRHVLRVRAEKLDADRAFDRIEVEIFAGALVPSENSFRRNELGGENVCAMFLAELAKNLVRHPGHRREEKRKLILKPG